MKRADFNFAFLFAVIAGAAILVLAIYGVTKISDTQRYQIDTQVAKQLAVLTDPLQAGFSEAQVSPINLNQQARISNLCNEGEFGENRIAVTTRSGIGKEYGLSGAEIVLTDKYLFSPSLMEGKIVYAFSTSFNYPFKVTDIIILVSEEYCFQNTPDDVQELLENLNLPLVKTANCTGNETKVCFGSSCSSADIIVKGTCSSSCASEYETGYIQKDGMKLNYVNNLMYAAIFSDAGIYNCNVERLMYRTTKLSEILTEKAEYMSSRNCKSQLAEEVKVLGQMTQNATSSTFISTYQYAKTLDVRASKEQCPLW